MKLKNILIVVSDIEKSKAFYKDLFGLSVVSDLGGNVILTEGLVLQEQQIWEDFIGKEVVGRPHDAVLYFEENDMDSFLTKLEKSIYDIEYLNKPLEKTFGARMVRIYDPDGHVIEIGEVGTGAGL